MKDAFFTTSTTKKRKRSNGINNNNSSSTLPKRSTSRSNDSNKGYRLQSKTSNNKDEDKDDDEDASLENGPSNIDELDLEASDVESSEEELEETAAEKRVRLAKAYLDKIQDDLAEDFAGGFDAADLDRDLIAERLRHDDDEAAGKLHRRVADRFDYTALNELSIPLRRGHQLSVTAVALTDNGLYFYSGSKDGSIIKWDAKTLNKLHVFPGGRKGVKNFLGHTDHVYCLATSSDNQYLASGGKDKIINIWSIKEDKHIATFTQHRDAVSGVVFRKGHNQLYSVSHDRTVKVWNIDEKSYVETLFGHQDQITAIDTLGRERCVSTGGRDKTTRLWKIVEESQLVYRGGVSTKNKDGSNRPLYVEGSLDCLAQIDESTFVTGGDSGVISLWDINRKKPVFTSNQSHGIQTYENLDDHQTIDTPFWITAIASLHYADLFVSGSWDGFIRFWKIAADNKSFTQVGQLAVKGVVNSLQIKTISPGNRTVLVIGLGQELRLGRWLRLKKDVKNGSKIVELPFLSKN
ncbi:WD40-repeat-containing domain protein [Halteromyces radiatus]|uniref:WD40-repeat-containing domain protein n=1 Tax=Halteromyces radiatus TaxID=101107 RepID=UPI002220EE71|nr:WD40-repeat-containing domain protein [Halteromyces radiatus]KAI8097265.1 WD40-repeat-containing domain protein [Halteromyces radiatus]